MKKTWSHSEETFIRYRFLSEAAYMQRKNEDPYEGLNVLHKESRGAVDLLLVGNTQAEIREVLDKQNPLVFDILPLTLEEVFIHELGGDDDAINELLF